MDQSICTVHIKEIFLVIFFATCGSLKDLLSILTSLISVWSFEIYPEIDTWQQAHSQKLAMGGCFGGLKVEPQPPEAYRGLGAKPPAIENFAFFAKIASF